MRRLISILAAGLLAAGTVLTTAGIASAGATAVQATGCTNDTGEFSWVTVSGQNFFLGTPNVTFPGAAARLKPMENSTTLWIHCNSNTVPNELLLINRGLALTSRNVSPGGEVLLEPAGNGGNGFASQKWIFAGSNPFTFQNVKTGLFLRVRNSGPIMFQTVTTGFTPTAWNQS